MLEGHNFIGFEKSAQSAEKIQVYSTLQKRYLSHTFSVATDEEIEWAIQKATVAFRELREISDERRAVFLEAIASEIESNAEENINMALLETALPAGRLKAETGRTVAQLRFFAKILREGNYKNCMIDLAEPDRAPVSKPGLRTINIPVGPILVFAASNFPFAFSTAGGDTASALAAGCPVILKAHPAHLGTNELIAGCIIRAAKQCNMPDGIFSSLNGEGAALGIKLAAHAGIKAIGFTGSREAGMSLIKIASERTVPIPVYAEMSSVNPVILLPGIVAEQAVDTAEKLASSIHLGAGQFCTNPGLIFAIEDESLPGFFEVLKEKLAGAPAQVMLNKNIAHNYYHGKNTLHQSEETETLLFVTEEKAQFEAAPALFKVSANTFLNHKYLQEEVFGPLSILVVCKHQEELLLALESLEGQLTATVFGTLKELKHCANLVTVLTEKAGRIIFNNVPTGVEVSYAMIHGGPFPSSSDARSTSVGGEALMRFLRPVCFQDCPQDILPDELKNQNERGMLRKIDGIYSNRSI